MPAKKSTLRRGRRGNGITKRRSHHGQKHGAKESFLWSSRSHRPVPRSL